MWEVVIEDLYEPEIILFGVLRPFVLLEYCSKVGSGLSSLCDVWCRGSGLICGGIDAEIAKGYGASGGQVVQVDVHGSSDSRGCAVIISTDIMHLHKKTTTKEMT